MEQLLALLPTILKVVAKMPELTDLITRLGTVGKDLFPQVTDLQAPSAGATVADEEGTRWIQIALNQLGSKLVVDGRYAGATKEAVMYFQQAHPPLKNDGWAGKETVRVLQDALAAK